MPTYPIRRRPRECKTCLPCRASKVRCDRNVPCSNCVKRNFTCSYGRPQSNRLPISSSLTASSTPLHSSFVSPAFTPTYSSAPPPPSQPHDLTDVSSVTDRPSQASDDPDLPELIDISQGEWDDINNKMVAMEQIIGSLHSIFQSHSSRRRRAVDPPPETMERKRSSQSEGVYGSNSSRTGAVHLGSRSALVDILDKSKHSKDMAQALPQEDLLADLALENESAAYPFVDLWSSDPYTFNIAGVCAVLPDDEQCRRYVLCSWIVDTTRAGCARYLCVNCMADFFFFFSFCFRFLGFYREIGAVLYPVLPDLDDLEYKASCLLDNRRRVGGVYKPDANGLVKPFGMDLPFLSLLFAVLASGCQLSDITERERELTSWVYGA